MRNHPSIKKDFSLRREEFQFKFLSLSENEVRKVILNMDEKKDELDWCYSCGNTESLR